MYSIEETHWLDGLDFSRTGDLLHLKVVVFIQAQEVDLFSISTEVQDKRKAILQENNGTVQDWHQAPFIFYFFIFSFSSSHFTVFHTCTGQL